MKPIDFQDCTLFISLRSPFARRVRIAFLEHGLKFETKVFNVFEPTPELLGANPLGRVPLVQLKSGEILIDSNLILQEFYRGRKTEWMPEERSARLECAKWMGIGAGLCEKTVEYFLETQRPELKRDPEVLEEVAQIYQRTFSMFETALQGRESIVPGQLTQADLDMGAALAYISLRYSTQWRETFPSMARYLDQLNTRPSFKETVPPA